LVEYAQEDRLFRSEVANQFNGDKFISLGLAERWRLGLRTPLGWRALLETEPWQKNVRG